MRPLVLDEEERAWREEAERGGRAEQARRAVDSDARDGDEQTRERKARISKTVS